jgi:hypothetical protein
MGPWQGEDHRRRGGDKKAGPPHAQTLEDVRRAGRASLEEHKPQGRIPLGDGLKTTSQRSLTSHPTWQPLITKLILNGPGTKGILHCHGKTC